MLRFSAPTLLVLSLALPSASLAIGLGDIRVESALHQPLSAQIDLVGATDEDLAGLRAGIPDQEMFQRQGLERPSVLTTIALKVSHDKQGRPVLALRSTEAFTEPMVTFLVDVHTPNGELIREYTVLLDPPDLAPDHDGVETASASPEPASAPVAQTSNLVTTTKRAAPASDNEPSGQTYSVAPHDTLDRIVTIAGAHSRSDRHRMMVAIFRANPGVFQTNLNNLRVGATLHYPSAAELSAISADEAEHEFASQMAAWRASHHRLPATDTASTNPVADATPDKESPGTDNSELNQRVQSLEKSIDELRQELKKPLVVQANVPVDAKAAPEPDMTTDESQLDEESEPEPPRRVLIASLAGGLALVLAAGAWFYRRRRSARTSPTIQKATPASSIRHDTEDRRSVDSDAPLPAFQQPALNASYVVEEVRTEVKPASPSAARGESGWFKEPSGARSSDPPAGGSTVNTTPAPIPVAPITAVPATDVGISDDSAALARELAFFNAENEFNSAHVVITSGTKESPPFVERRKNPADVLRQAIEREPDRSDLRLKLLELYYTAAAQNRRAFLEVTRQLAKNEKLASGQEWTQIADMGRIIAPDDELFSDTRDDKAVA